jgi:hypothetical protein
MSFMSNPRDISEILLKMALNTITVTLTRCYHKEYISWFVIDFITVTLTRCYHNVFEHGKAEGGGGVQPLGHGNSLALRNELSK